MPKITQKIEPGQRIVITQQIPQRARVWVTRVEGEVIKVSQKMTGAWFAHAKNNRLWLDRVTLRKDDGEFVECNLDQYAHVRLIAPAASSEQPPMAEDEVSESDEGTEPSQADEGTGGPSKSTGTE